MNYDDMKEKKLGEVLGETKDIMADAIQELSFDDLERYRDNMRLLREAYEKQQELEKTMNLEPLWAAIAEVLSLPEYENISFTSLMLESVDDAGQIIPGSVFDQVIEKAKKLLAAQDKPGYLEPIGSAPNSDSLNWLFKVIATSKGGRMVRQSKQNRHEQVRILESGDTLRFEKTNKQKESSVIIDIEHADKYLTKTSKTFTKMLMFTLQKMAAQHFPPEVGFSLQEIVDLGMYSTTSNARRAVKDFFDQQKSTTLRGAIKKGKKTIREEGGILFYHYKIDNGYVRFFTNENFNMEFIANYFTVFPRFAYRLKDVNAFSLVRFIFFLARQNTRTIKEKGTFTISLEAIRDNLGLPSVDQVKNRKYKQYIIDPIEKAIEELENAIMTEPEAQDYCFTITPHGTDTSKIEEWLEGYLEIGLSGNFAETFIRIATETEKKVKRFEDMKQKEAAKIAAKSE